MRIEMIEKLDRTIAAGDLRGAPIRDCPPPGHGVHQWTLSAANTLARLGVAPDQAAQIIRARMTRRPRGREIEDAIEKAYREAHLPIPVWSPGGQPSPTAAFDPGALARVARRGPGVDIGWLRARSPLDPFDQTPDTYLRALFREGEVVLVFNRLESQGDVAWVHRGPGCVSDELDRFREGQPDGTWFLSNPVDGQMRANAQGRMSRRSEGNITSFRHLVVESDRADPAQWLSVIVQAPLPVVSLVTSGGKSIHALVRVNARDGEHWRMIVGRIRPILVTLGADAGAMSAVRLTRLPDCMRVSKGRRQELLFLNPDADGTPIRDLPLVRDGEMGVAA